MKFPDKIQVGGHIYKVKLKESYSIDKNAGACAWHGGEELIISVAKQLCDGENRPSSRIFESLIHETIHAISTVWNEELTERQVSALAEGLAQVLPQWGLELEDVGVVDDPD